MRSSKSTMVSSASLDRAGSPPEAPPDRPRSGPGDVEDRFVQFSELSAAFSRMILGLEGRRNDLDPRREVVRNLQIARGVFGKWGSEILIVLYAEPQGVGFEALRRAVEGISPRVLSIRLKHLERADLLVREVLSDRPPRVLYRLTPRGKVVARMAEPLFLFLDRFAREMDPQPSSSEPRGGPGSTSAAVAPVQPALSPSPDDAPPTGSSSDR